jgi:hypothetical protein
MSFGGGESPSNTSFQTQYTRDAPQIEAAKLGLMQTAQDYTRFGMNPWEASAPGSKPGDTGYGEYEYKGPAGGAYAPGTKFSDLTREQRAREGQAGGAAGIPTQQVAAFSPQQQEAFNLASEGIGAYQPLLDQSKQFTQQSTQQYDPQSYQQYMNPYQDEVIAGIEQQFGKAGAGLDLQAAKSGAFGGARQGIQSAELAGQQARAVGQAQAQNYGQAQQQAQQQFASQVGRYGQAGQQMAGLAGQQQQQQLGDVASLMSAGSVQQQAQQQFLDAQYQQQLQQLYEPYQRLGFTSDIYQGMPSSAMAISMGTSPGSNPLAQTVGAGIAGLGAYQGYKNVTGG